MSYDLRIGVKVDGTDIIAVIAQPERHSPTYNIGDLFRKCTGWDFEQSEWYRVSEVYPLIQHGLAELIAYPNKYKKYESPNGWGTIGSAIEALKSLKDCIDELSEEKSYCGWNHVPMEYLWMAW